MTKEIRYQNGFTLVEVLIALSIGVIVLTAVYAFYSSQQRMYSKERHMTNTQQNLRACMYLLDREIKQARLDPTGRAKPAILIADSHTFWFEADLDGNGHDFTSSDSENLTRQSSNDDENERIRFQLTNDRQPADGIADGFPCSLGRASWNENLMPMADNIEVLNFVYRNANGNILGPLPLNEANRLQIRTVEVTLVARSAKELAQHTDTQTYRNLENIAVDDEPLLSAPNDHYYRKKLSKIIQLRN